MLTISGSEYSFQVEPRECTSPINTNEQIRTEFWESGRGKMDKCGRLVRRHIAFPTAKPAGSKQLLLSGFFNTKMMNKKGKRDRE